MFLGTTSPGWDSERNSGAACLILANKCPKGGPDGCACGISGEFDLRALTVENGGSSFKANPTSGGVPASTEMLAAKRHAGVHTPVIACKMIIANQQMAYAA